VRVDVDPRAANPDAVTSLIAARPDTAKYVTTATSNVTVPALGSIPFIAYRGDSSWIGYVLIQGRWFASPGEVVAPSNVFRTAGVSLGDKLSVTSNGRSLTVTLVGEIFDQARENSNDLVLRGEWADLAFLNPGLTPSGWEILPTAGTDPREYASDLRQATHDEADAQVARDSQSDEGFLLFDRVIALLGAVLVAISLGGVFNMVLLETRHRTRQTAILKAIGMTPRQVIGMVLASVVPVALLAGVIGVPAGLVLHHVVLDFMADAATSTNLPKNVLDVLPVGLLILFGLAGLAIGAVGAYLPARRTARSLIAPVLQSE
jgi:putative ABC transport system permease protein